ncbi:hypothetical protein [Halosegnis longus]|uniref:hypothetical protein n=1 Tax=Halosegnis longus TaxID=2216012 RepID=UPI00129DB349|nr:hypothetical protein [Halosegnis longus]
MGQYFRPVNPDKKEYLSLPSLAKLPEKVSDPLSGQIMLYLLFEGPFDGTTLLDRLYDQDDERVVEATAARIEDEQLRERQVFMPDDDGGNRTIERALKRAIRDADGWDEDEFEVDIDAVETYPMKIRQGFAENLYERAMSTYRVHERDAERDPSLTVGEWNMEKLKRIVCAGFQTGDDAMCGRWAGDSIRLIGDYAGPVELDGEETDLYTAMEGTVVADITYGNTTERIEWRAGHPTRIEVVDDDDTSQFGTTFRDYREEASPGDSIRVRKSAVPDYIQGDQVPETATFVRYEETEWTDITDDVYAEMARYMPGQFGELVEDEDLSVTEQFGTGQNSA